MKTSRPIRIGQINYANVWPVFYHFPHEKFNREVEFIAQVPTGLNKAMADGDIDMGPISSFAYGENFAEYVLFPDLSVSSLGEVQSILLFHQSPLSELEGREIALPTTSATSVNLLKILLGKFNRVYPRYRYASPSLSDMMKQSDAALLIGDDAIRASWTSHPYEVTDLGELWRKATGQWMSFAVWAVRKQVIQEQPELVNRIFQAFVFSKQRSLLNPSLLINEAKNSLGGKLSYWQRYFQQLNYNFGPEQWSGLQLYYDFAFELGLLKQQVPLQIWQDKSVIKVKE